MSYSNFSLDVSLFWDYWDSIKNEISAIFSLGNNLYSMQDTYQDLANRAESVGDSNLVMQAQDGANRTSSMFITWTSIKNKLTEWLPNFLNMTSEAESGLSGFGFAFALPAWAIAMLVAGGMAALAYIVTNWQRLKKDYNTERALMEDVKNKVITAEQAAQIIRAEEGNGGWGGGIIQQAGQVGMIALLGIGGLVAYTIVRSK